VGKLTKEVIDEIKRLAKEGYTKKEISEKIGVNRKTVAKYIEEDEVLKVGEAKKIDEEFEVFKMQGRLIRTCKELLNGIETIDLEDDLIRERDLIGERLRFLREKAENATDLGSLRKIRELLDLEEKEIEALIERDSELRRRKKELEREAKRRWVFQRLMEDGMTEEEIEKYIEGQDLEYVYDFEKESERIDRTREECLKHMSLEDYNRLSMLFTRSFPNAKYLINFWKQEKEIIAEYGPRELEIFYETHQDLIAKKPNLKAEFERYIKKKYPYLPAPPHTSWHTYSPYEAPYNPYDTHYETPPPVRERVIERPLPYGGVERVIYVEPCERGHDYSGIERRFDRIERTLEDLKNKRRTRYLLIRKH